MSEKLIPSDTTNEQPQASITVPTTKILAIGRLTATATPDAVGLILPHEVQDTVRLHLKGIIEQWWVRTDGKGVVFLLAVHTPDAAHEILEKLPLGTAGLMEFDLIPLGPLQPLGLLLSA